MLDLILVAVSGIGIATLDHSPRLSSAPLSLAPFGSGQIWLGSDSPPPPCSLLMLPTLVLSFQHYISKLRFGETGRDEHQHSWHGPQPQREQNRHPAFPQSHTPAVTLCYRMAAWPHPHGLAAERSDRESSQSRNLELCLHPSLELEGHSVSPNSLQKRSNLFASLQHGVSHAWFIPLLFQMFLLSSPVTPPPLTTNGWKHTVLTGTFCVWILWLLASGIIANFILLPSHWLCLPLSLQNLFSPQRLFSQDNRRKKNWIMKFPYISYEKYIKLTFSTSKDCNLSLAVLPLFPIAA